MTWTINHTITATIDGINRTSALMERSLYIRQNIGNDADVASFELRDATGSINPHGWDPVTITVDGVTVFGGYIVQRDGKVRSQVDGVTHWTVECKDWSILLDTVQVNESYGMYESGGTMFLWDDRLIIQNLFATYLPGEGFNTTTYVVAQDTVEIAFQNITLRAALNQLAIRVGADWYIDPQKQVRWFNPASPPAALFSINSVSPNYSTSYPPLGNSVQRTVDDISVVNQVVVVGGNTQETNNETFIFGTDTLTLASGIGIQLTYVPNGVAIIQARFSVLLLESGDEILRDPFGENWPLELEQNTSVGVSASGTGRLGFAPQDKLVMNGGNAWFLVDLSTGIIRMDTYITNQMAAGDTITVNYSYLAPITVTRNDLASQETYGRVLSKTVYDETLSYAGAAEEYGDTLLTEWALGRETITFDVLEHGLLPGHELTMTLPEIDIGDTILVQLESGDLVLLESNDGVLSELSDTARTYLIQQVAIRPIVTATNEFAVVAQVTVGVFQNTLIEALRRLGASAGMTGAGVLPAVRNPGQLSDVSSSLGVVLAGRAVFTDGGTAWFDWNQYNNHTGVAIGLDDTDGNPRGNLLMLEGGSVRAKVGYLNNLGTLSGMVPTGWGIFTDNGWFTGAVNATSGSIGGFVLAANKMYADAGTISTSEFVNSSNPGVMMNADGLFGFGTLGLTFALYSDPALAPWLSSGTINNVVYEIYESAILRTSANPFANGGIQIDNTGIYGISPITFGTGFYLDALTGNAYLKGTVTASVITASSLSGGTVTGGTVTGALVSGGTVSGGTVTGSLFTAGTISMAGGTVTITDSGIRFGVTDTIYNALNFFEGNDRVARVGALATGGRNFLSMYAGTANSQDGMVEMKGESAQAGEGSASIVVDPGGDNFLGTAQANAYIMIIPDLDNFSAGKTRITGSLVDSEAAFHIAGTVGMDSKLTVGGTVTFNGVAFLNSEVWLGNISTDVIHPTGHFQGGLVPSSNGIYPLGDLATGWSGLYLTRSGTVYLVEINSTGNGLTVTAQ